MPVKWSKPKTAGVKTVAARPPKAEKPKGEKPPKADKPKGGKGGKPKASDKGEKEAK